MSSLGLRVGFETMHNLGLFNNESYFGRVLFGVGAEIDYRPMIQPHYISSLVDPKKLSPLYLAARFSLYFPIGKGDLTFLDK